MKTYRRIFLFLLAILGSASLSQAVSDELLHDFETEAPGWAASSNSSITTSDQHAKSGTHSLEWKWRNSAARLKVDFPPQRVEQRKNNATHFGLWLYNEKPLNKRLRVQIFSGSKELCSFWFNLNYQGWRVLGANYIALKVPAGAMVDQAVFHAPSPSGKLWLDAVKPAFMSAPIQPDDCQPWASNPEILKLPPKKTYYSSKNINLNRSFLPPLVKDEKISSQSKEDMQRLEKLLSQRLLDRRGAKYPTFEELCTEFDNLGIVEQDSSLKGPPLEFGGSGMFLPLADSLNFNEKFMPILEKISEAVQREQGENKQKAEVMYLTMCRYLLDQGLQEGNNNYGWIGNGYDFRHFPSRIFTHADLLNKAGILNPILKSVAHLCMGKEMLSENPFSSCDQFYNYSPHLPIAILMLSDEAERYQRMRAFKQYMDKVILNDLPIGKDGSIHHHHGHHLSYGAYSPPKMVRTQILPFKGTEFFISPQAHKKIRTLAKATSFQSMHGKLSPNLYLRSGVPIGLDVSALTLPIALMGSPDNNSPVDREIAALYLDAIGNKDTAEAKQFRTMGITPTRPSGHLSLNLAAIAIHRLNDWQAAAAGMIKQFRGLEIYGWMENNNYGKQSRNGSLFLTIGDKTGWKREGWNWNFWPGATTSVFKDSADLIEGYTMYGNTNNMGGGVSENGNGIWGNDFSAHGVSFKKSMFFFGNKITLITTDISSSSDKEIVTTLFQQSADDALTSPSINKQQITQEKTDGNKPTSLQDSLGNFYYVHEGAPLNFQTGEQEWTYFFKSDLIDAKNNPCLDMRKKHFRESPLAANSKYYKPTKGTFHLAYLNHGINPKGADCAYTILMQASPETADQFERKMGTPHPPVNIIARNSGVHTVYDPESRTTGYVIFNPSAKLPPPLKRSNRPGFVLVRDLENGYKISVSTGDPAQNEEFRIEMEDGRSILVRPNYPLSGSIVIGK